MKKILFLVAMALGAFFVEYLLCNIIEPRFVPNLLLLCIVFVDLYLGIRHGIFVAVMAGILKDSFELQFLGVNMLSFLTIAYAAIVFKKFLYVAGSRSSKTMLVVAVMLVVFPVEYVLQRMSTPVNLWQALGSVFIPQLIVTSLISSWFLNFLKQCASKSSVYSSSFLLS